MFRKIESPHRCIERLEVNSEGSPRFFVIVVDDDEIKRMASDKVGDETDADRMKVCRKAATMAVNGVVEAIRDKLGRGAQPTFFPITEFEVER